jgi:uncharacterized membrane protein (DUF4010 family)
VPSDLPVSTVIAHLAAALLVGTLIGAQREAARSDRPGLRDFLLIALGGGVCGVLGNPYLSAAGLASTAALLAVYHFEERETRAGITTEFAGVATFVLALLASSGQVRSGEPIALGTGILIAVFLEAKQRLQHLLRETITEPEFNATLAFVTVVLVIYPLLPEGTYGPYSFFSPRQVWMFVILISSISYAGYFLEKFLGEERGLVYTSILGGLASTTAVTLHLGRLSKERPEGLLGQLRGFLIANSVQFPRAFLLIAVVNPDLAVACGLPLGLMLVAAILMAYAAGRMANRAPHQAAPARVEHENPFQIRPALQFGALFTLIMFITKAAAARAGTQAFIGTSLLGGLVDVATVIAPASDLVHAQTLSIRSAELAILLALASNAALKLALAAITGTRAFTLRLFGAFLLWAAVGAVGYVFTP